MRLQYTKHAQHFRSSNYRKYQTSHDGFAVQKAEISHSADLLKCSKS